MQVVLHVRSQNFRGMCSDLARMSGRDYDYVLTSEAASCIKIAALQSPIASAADIKKQVQERSGGSWTIPGGEFSVNQVTNRGRVWFWDKELGGRLGYDRAQRSADGAVAASGAFYMIVDTGPARGHRVPDEIWATYLSSREERLALVRARTKEIMKRRGIERLSWLQMADGLGVSLATVAPNGALRESVARGAAVRGRQYPNGSARRTTDLFRLKIIVTNESPVAVKRWGQKRIQDAMRRRTKAFEIAMKKGLFDDAKRRAQRWPGIFVKPL